jgi:hypothetical protein
VLEDVGVVLGRVGRVGRDRHAAGGQDREVGEAPLRPVLRHERHPVAGRHAEHGQATGEPLDLALRLPPGERHVGALALGPEERAVAAGLDPALERLDQVPAELAAAAARHYVATASLGRAS